MSQVEIYYGGFRRPGGQQRLGAINIAILGEHKMQSKKFKKNNNDLLQVAF